MSTARQPESSQQRGRLGRPRIGEEEARRERVLDAAFDCLIERGYKGATMLAVAKQAGSSKETLYTWFGNKQGLFEAMIERQSATMNDRLRAALEIDEDLEPTLTALAIDLLALLLGERSLALNRAAMSEPQLATALLRLGRQTTGPLVESYLARQIEQGRLQPGAPSEVFQVFYGLLVRDSQIRALLGDPSFEQFDVEERAIDAVQRFLSEQGGS